MSAPSTDVVYVRRSTCESHLPPLTQQPVDLATRERVLRVGQVVPCPDCGRMWQVVQTITWGGVVQVAWECFRPASVADPVAARLAALEDRATKAEALLAALMDANAAQLQTVAALGSSLAAIGSRTVTVRRALPAATSVIAINGKQDVAVTWLPAGAFPDTGYAIQVLPVPSLLNKVTVAEKSRTKDGAVFTVTSSVLIALGTALLDVTATRYG